jgi:adenine-specific DNA-methyltransferase
VSRPSSTVAQAFCTFTGILPLVKATSVQLPIDIHLSLSQDSHGAVYTKPWVVELILDLASYTDDVDLGAMVCVEPAVGDGAFVVAMVRRLVQSCRRHGRDVRACQSAILGFDLDLSSVTTARESVSAVLVEFGVAIDDARTLAAGWIRVGNFLFEAPSLPSANFVIGNPPYIRLEEIGDEIMTAYRAMYRTMKGRADIYVAFFEAALRQLRPSGVCAYICADRWMLNQYGGELRSFVTSGYSVETVVDMHTANAFESDVSAYPAITVIRRVPQGSVVVARADAAAASNGAPALSAALLASRIQDLNGNAPAGLVTTRVESWFDGSAPWPCTSPERLQILRRLEDEFDPLESAETGTKVGIGVATGRDDVFITADPDLVEPDRLLPLALARDTLSGTLEWSGHYLVDPWNAHGVVDLANFPRLAAYYEAHREALMNRNVAKRRPQHWYRTIDRVTHALTQRTKLYFPDIKDRIHPVLDRGQTYPHHNLYFIQSDGWDLEVLGGLLLSDIGQFFVECYGVRMRGGWLRFQAQYLRRIRVPKPEDIAPEHARGLVEAFRRRDRHAASLIALELYRLDRLPTEEDERSAGDA